MLSRALIRIFAASVLTLSSASLFAEDNRPDFDLDDDGLIEVNDLADLDEIRNSLDGTSLYGKSEGCPETGCNGFELTTDLDFDTNGDGVIDSQDTYWNDGQGWLPIATVNNKNYFKVLNGNGFSIRNLYINRPSQSFIGLFSKANFTNIKAIAFTGSLTYVSGYKFTGLLTGSGNDSVFSLIFTSGEVSGTSHVGSVAGTANRSSFEDILSTTNNTANSYKGGIIGSIYSGTLKNSLATGYISPTSSSHSGALIGSSTNTSLTTSYWPYETTGIETTTSSTLPSASLSQLQCATTPTDSQCTPDIVLYDGWSNETWDFGASAQLPALRIGNRVYRDSDGDNSLDAVDRFPLQYEASIDADDDGYPDIATISCNIYCQTESNLVFDSFLYNASAGKDQDSDGFPDEWAPSCDEECQLTSELRLDEYPEDQDNDAVPDILDADDNGDGIIDVDSDSDGLIEIHNIHQLNEIRNNLDGTALFNDSTGCPRNGCYGFELAADINFDTNQDGVIDSQDDYWNDGLGWDPIGPIRGTYFSGSFNGNGYAIKNIYINRPDQSYIGLFSRVKKHSDLDNQISNFAFTGALSSISGNNYVGFLAGSISDISITLIFSGGKSSASSYSGGLVGYGTNIRLSNIFSSTSITVSSEGGGIAGGLYKSILFQSIATGSVQSSKIGDAGGLSGDATWGEISYSHWADNSTTMASPSAYSHGSEFNDIYRTSLADLQCALSVNDTLCVEGKALYNNWDPNLWDFGTPEQLPALVIEGRLYRDSDGDGVSDEEDSFVYDRTAAIDSDHDGYPDIPTPGCGPSCQNESPLIYDRFPGNSAAGDDSDGDGSPDQWASICDATCQSTSGLTLDEHPGDHDNDGFPDDVDTDDNNDGIIDADADSDGLIDIASLEELNAVRYETTGNGQKLSETSTADSSGCPRIYYDSRCRGYELTQTLDFDTNSDGLMNEADEYWNEGEGWLPLFRLESEFNGNGYAIRNLYINRPSTNSIGLFTYLSSQSWLHDLALTGPLVYISGRNDTGTLAGSSGNTTIERVLVNTHIDGEGIWTGGVVGDSNNTVFSDIFVSGNVYGPWIVGGISGGAENSVFRNSVSSTYIDGGQVTGGLYSYGENNVTIASYYAADLVILKTATEGGYTPIESNIHLKDLQCPTTETDTTCNSENTLYDQWDSNIWDFGGRIQLPTLRFPHGVYRDSDGDGVLDEEDAFSTIHTASIDTDKDGYPDRYTEGCDLNCIANSGLNLDKFPLQQEAWQDDDNDGLPDTWNAYCDQTCISGSDLALDEYPGDSNNDGITNEQEIDQGGARYLADSDSDGLIDIFTLEQLNEVRYQLYGHGRKSSEMSSVDSSGCPPMVSGGVPITRCYGYELMNDLDFDTNGNGEIDEGDRFWNNGMGWQPIGDVSAYFNATFEGNGYAIRNFYLNGQQEYGGLFFVVQGVNNSITNLAFINADITAVLPAVVATGVFEASVENIFISGKVSGEGGSSLLTAYAQDAVIKNIFVSGSTNEIFDDQFDRSMNTVVGEAVSGNFSHIISVATAGDELPYTLIGGGVDGQTTGELYLRKADSSAATDREIQLGFNIHSLTELQCPTGPDNTTCVEGTTMYEGWDTDVWDFGSSSQLPGMRFANGILRDSDGDGIPDENNAPEITLTLTQDGNEEEEIITGMGDVTISASVTDIDESDTHELVWSLEGVHNSYKLGNSVTFNPDTLPEGEYRMAVTVTDNGYPSMNATAEIITRVIAGVQAPVAAPPPAETGGSGAGSNYFWWMLMFGSLLYANRRQAM